MKFFEVWGHFLMIVLSLWSCSEPSIVNLPSIDTKDSIKSTYNESPIGLREGEGIMFNISADGLVLYPDWGGDIEKKSKEDIESSILKYLIFYSNTQITTILINFNFQRSCYPSKIMEPYWLVENPEKDITDWPKLHWQIHKKGIDLCGLYINTCKEVGISPWLSIRMNDHHYFSDTSKINHLWRDHPEYRLSNGGLFNYGKKDVRNYFKAIIEEALQRYDVDGIELDWMRTFTVFKKGEEAKGLSDLNIFMQEIRNIVNRIASIKGHPIKIAVRVPSSPEISLSFGLDAINWANREYVDAIIPTNWYHPTNLDIPIEKWRKNIQNTKCKVIAGADGAYCIADNPYLKRMGNSIESMRGFAVSAYSRGADAIYLFNNGGEYFGKRVINKDGSTYVISDRADVFHEIGRYSTSTNKPRTHIYTYTYPSLKPITNDGYLLDNGESKSFLIHTGLKPTKGNFIVRIGIDKLPGFETTNLDVQVNSKTGIQIEDMYRNTSLPYINTKPYDFVFNVSETSARVMQFNIELDNINDGYNTISVTNRGGKPQKIIWLEVYI